MQVLSSRFPHCTAPRRHVRHVRHLHNIVSTTTTARIVPMAVSTRLSNIFYRTTVTKRNCFESIVKPPRRVTRRSGRTKRAKRNCSPSDVSRTLITATCFGTLEFPFRALLFVRPPAVHTYVYFSYSFDSSTRGPVRLCTTLVLLYILHFIE